MKTNNENIRMNAEGKKGTREACGTSTYVPNLEWFPRSLHKNLRICMLYEYTHVLETSEDMAVYPTEVSKLSISSNNDMDSNREHTR